MPARTKVILVPVKVKSTPSRSKGSGLRLAGNGRRRGVRGRGGITLGSIGGQNGLVLPGASW